MVNTLIIGSSRGIGLCITKDLLKKGHIVKGISRKEPLLTEKKNYSHINLDISLTEKFSNYLKEININDFENFIVCAGTNDVAKLNQITNKRLLNLYKTNLFPSFELLKQISQSHDNKPKSIVLFSSIWSSFGIAGRSMYGSSKAALVALAKHASSELSPYSIFVNCISPGFTNTELSNKTKKDPLISQAIKRSSNKSFQETEAISNAILMLLNPNNKGITGQEIFVDSGFSSHA